MDWRAIRRKVINYMTPIQWVIFIALISFSAYKVREEWQIDDEIEKYSAEAPGIMVDYYRWGHSTSQAYSSTRLMAELSNVIGHAAFLRVHQTNGLG